MEAANFAGFYKLDNLVGIIDVNRLGQSDPTSLQHDMECYKARYASYGWNAVVVDGHSVEEICKAMADAEQCKGKPTMILAKTYKGHGVAGVANEDNWHGKPLGAKGEEAIAQLRSQMADPDVTGEKVNQNVVTDDAPALDLAPICIATPRTYKARTKVATRAAYGTALAKLGENSTRVVALDGDTKNSTFAITFQKKFPERFIECFIAEQNLVGVGMGCATRQRTVAFCSTFAAFFSRAYDQIRMGAPSMSHVKLAGSHVGCSIGEDGPSQMALEDIAMFRAINNCVVFYPSDAVSCERVVELAANHPSMVFIRTSRPATLNVYKNDEVFEIGKGKVIRQSESDACLLIGAGITLHECLKAADQLKEQGMSVRVFDPVTIKPLDAAAVIKNAVECGGKIVVSEDHYPEGGLGEAVCGAVAMEGIRVKRLAVNGLPRSGPSAQLMDMFGISARHIVDAVKSF